MCGRYTQTVSLEKVIERFHVDDAPMQVPPRYNVAPGQQAPVIIYKQSRRIELMRWGLVPAWAKDPRIGNRMINARAESLTEKPSFRRPFSRSRCLIAADGFYEWRRSGPQGRKVPMWIGLKSREPFAFAGLWDRWQTATGGVLESFTIITTLPNELMKPIHHRMPLILRQHHETEWLDPDLSNPGDLARLLEPCPAEEMTAYEVSTLVNSPENDVLECLKPV